MRKLLATTLAVAASLTGAAHAASMQVQAGDGYMNVRSGPGTNYALIGTVPNGTTYNWPGEPTCVARRDGITGADWCKVKYNGVDGWVSRSGLMPIGRPGQQQPALPDFTEVEVIELTCQRPQMLAGYDPRDTNPVVQTEVSYAPVDHSWRVFHHLADGGTVSRTEQYAVVDMTKPAGGNAHWTGSLNRNRALLMVGVVQFTQGEEVYYYEDMYNREKGNRLEMRSRAICYPKNVEESRTAPPPQEPLMRKGQAEGSPTPKRVIAAPPSQVMAKDSVPIYHTGTKVMVDVLVGVNPVRMVLDTGAEMMQVSQDLADKIVREGQGSWGAWQTFVMADGRKVKQQTINIESVKIGGHIVRNVPCSISSDGAPIMAFPIINAIGPFKIDTRNNELVFEPKVEAKG